MKNEYLKMYLDQVNRVVIYDRKVKLETVLLRAIAVGVLCFTGWEVLLELSIKLRFFR